MKKILPRILILTLFASSAFALSTETETKTQFSGDEVYSDAFDECYEFPSRATENNGLNLLTWSIIHNREFSAKSTLGQIQNQRLIYGFPENTRGIEDHPCQTITKALHLAMKVGAKLSIILDVIAAGPSVNTPMYFSSEEGIIEKLPLDYANELGWSDVAAQLRKAGALSNHHPSP